LPRLPRLRRLLRHHPALIALIAGGLHALSFAPGPLPGWLLPIWQLATLAALVCVLACVCERERARAAWRAARLGWCFGLPHFGIGLYWLTISMHTYGHLAAPLAVAALIALAAALALFPALACAGAAWLAPRGSTANIAGRALIWAACWTLAEWLRGTLLTGLPWLNIGYAHIDGPYAGWAPVVGVYGVAWLAAFASALVGMWLQVRTQIRTKTPTQIRTQTPALAIVAASALAGLALAQINWATPHGALLEVRLVQGNIDQGEKFNPAQMRAAIDQHLQQAALPPVAGAPQPVLIVLAETIMPVFQHQVPLEVWQAWREVAAGHPDRTIVMGAPLYDQGHYTNSVIGITAATPLAALQVALRQAPPGAVRRIRPRRFSLAGRCHADTAGRL